MKNNQQYQRNKHIHGSIALGAGAVLFALSFFLKNTSFPENYNKLLQGIGVFLILWGVMILVQVYLYSKHPAALKKEMIEHLDERKTWIRYRSGYNAFLLGVGSTYITLLVVGMTKAAIDPDLAWWVLAGIVTSTLVVFVISLVYYENKY